MEYLTGYMKVSYSAIFFISKYKYVPSISHLR